MNPATYAHMPIASNVRVIEHVGAHGMLQSELITHGLDAIRFDARNARGRRRCGRLSMSNDLGSGSAHVVVIHVNGFSATLTYSDTPSAHNGALLRNVLEPYCSDAAPSAVGVPYELHAGRYTSLGRTNRDEYVKFFGSRLVFCIDRQCARRQVERFVKKTDAIVLLKWADRNHVGQCAFLRQGNVHLIATAVAHAGGAQMRIGVRLDQLLGGDSTRALLMTAVGVVFDVLSNHQSSRVINDDIEQALLRYLETTHDAVLAAAVDHAVLMSSCLRRIRGALVRLGGRPGDDPAECAARCWQKHPSDIASLRSHLLEQTTDRHSLHLLLTEAGAAAESLEQAAFKLTFVLPQPDPKDIALLGYLVELVNRSTCEYVKCLEQAQGIRRTPAPPRSALERILATIDRLADCERRSSASVRVFDAALLRGDVHPDTTVLLEVARAFCDAIEALARCSLVARDYVFGTMAGEK